MSGVDAGKERKLLPMHTRAQALTYPYCQVIVDVQ